MSKNPDRPSLSPKHTRTSEATRTSELDEGMKITVDGDSYILRIGDLTPALVRELRTLTGMSAQRVMECIVTDPDIDVISTFVWLARRTSGDADVALDDVNVGYHDLLSDGFNVTAPGRREVEDSPEI